jgi:hypothetical protein
VLHVIVYNHSGHLIALSLDPSMDLKRVHDTLFENGLDTEDMQMVKVCRDVLFKIGWSC